MTQTDATDPHAGPSPHAAATAWLSRLESVLAGGNPSDLKSIFMEDGWWRDLIAVTWDIRAFAGIDAIIEEVGSRAAAVGFSDFRVSPGKPPRFQGEGAQMHLLVFFDFETAIAHCRGVARLFPASEGQYRAWTVMTEMVDLVGHEVRSTSVDDIASMDFSSGGRVDYYGQVEARREFADSDPEVLVVGGGHSGLMLAAHLEHLGLPTLVVEKNPRIGDNWRNRYTGLSLHDLAWSSQFPYLPFPDNWPIFTPKDMLADWMESYAWMLQLRTWTSAEVRRAEYDEVGRRWSVDVVRDGQTRTLKPSHLVFATGLAGVPYVPDVPGMDNFSGEAVHSGAHVGGPAVNGKRVVVVGSGSTAHDIVEDAYHSGAASVTMVQRGPTYVMSSQRGVPLALGLWAYPDQTTIEEADQQALSLPLAVAVQSARGPIEQIADLDRELLDKLEKVGFGLTFGDEGGGSVELALKKGGRFYFDKGCSSLIADGKVTLKRGEIERFTDSGVVFSDGTSDEADLVVFGTGWSNMREAVRPICGDEVTDSLTEVWGQDDEGELKTVWRHSGHPRLWFQCGGLVHCRLHSKHLALQILGVQQGLVNREPALAEVMA